MQAPSGGLPFTHSRPCTSFMLKVIFDVCAEHREAGQRTGDHSQVSERPRPPSWSLISPGLVWPGSAQ